jgi:hypothetical protein
MRRPRHRKKKSTWPFTPQIIAPDGIRLYHVRQIPNLPLPKHIVVRDDYLFIDGWFVLINPFWMSTLRWFDGQIHRWIDMDTRPENKAQISGILDALETAAMKFGLYGK